MQPDLSKYYIELGTNAPTLEDINADEQAAGATYNASVHSAWLTQIGGYGDAEVTESKNIGTAQVTLATALGGDEVTLATAEAGVANTLATEEATADETLTDAIDAQNTTDAETTADDQSSTTSSEGGDEEATQQQLANEEVTTAGLLAGDQADYAIATANYLAAAAAALAQAQPTGANQFASLYAQGYVTWLTDLKTSFVNNATAVAQAAANDEVALTTADANLADQEATANATETTTEAPQSASESEAIDTESNTYQTSVTSNVGQDQVSSATADQQQLIALAQSASTFITANAQADKTAQLNADNLVSGWQATQIKAIADAKLALTDSQADDDQAWINAKSTADSQFLQDDAASWQTDVTAQATAANTFSKADDAAAATLNDSAAGAEATVMTDQAAADQTQANADAQAETGFAQAEADQTMSSWYNLATSSLAGQAGDAWATFEYHKSQSLDSWQTTADNNYTQYVSTLATDEVTYASTDSQKFLSEAQNIDAADKTDGDNNAAADQTLVNTLAGDEVAYETVAATATAAYQTAMAQAAHDNVVSLATAVDNYAHDGNSTNYNNAVNAAATALANAQSAAATQYQDGTVATTGADGIGVATATQETNDANALLTDAQTVAGDDQTDAQTADLQIDIYSKAESDAYDLQTKNDATALDTLIKGDADALKVQAATADSGNPSSWMDQWAAQTAADDSKEDADADVAMNATNSTADALDIKEKNEADAQQKKDDGDAQAIHDKTANDAQATHDQSISDAGNITTAIAKDAYFATLPDVYPAFTWDPTLNPALLDASYDEVYAVDDLALPLSAGQDDGSSPLPPGDVIGNAVNGIPSLAPSPQSPAPVLGQSFSLGATTDPFSGIATSATPMVTTLLNDNGVYDPGNPYSSFTGWPGSPYLTGETMPLPGGQSGNYTFMPTSDGPPQTGGGQGGGGGGQPNPSPPPGQEVAFVPPTDAQAPKKDEGDASQETGTARKQPAPNGHGHTFVFGFTGGRIGDFDAGDKSFSNFGNTLAGEVLDRVQTGVAKGRQKDTLTPRERAEANKQADALYTRRVYEWDAKSDKRSSAPIEDMLQGVAKDLKSPTFKAAQRDKPDLVKGYTVRMVLIGYSWGAARAVEEADRLSEKIKEVGMIPEISVEVIDGVNRPLDPNPGLAMNRVPNAQDPKIPVANHFTPRGYMGNDVHGGSIDGAETEEELKDKEHLTMDEAVLTGKKGSALAKKIADLILKPYPGKPAVKRNGGD